MNKNTAVFDLVMTVICIVLILSLASSEVTVLEVTPAAPATGTSAPTQTPARLTKTATPLPSSTVTPTEIPTPINTPEWGAVLNLYFDTLPEPYMQPAASWSISDEGVKMIASFEGYYASPYNDGGSVGNCTIGYGHLLHLGICTGGEGGAISQAAALQLLKRDLGYCERYTHELVDVHISQHQFDSITSLICNWGKDKFGKSQILMALNQGLYYEAAEVWKTTATCGINIGCGLPGLIKRRQVESANFMKLPTE